MQRIIELPGRKANPNRLILFLIFAIVAVVLGKSTALSYYVDALWFGSLGYSEVFWKSLGLEWSVFGTFFAATFLILYGWFLALWQMHQPDLPHDRAIFIGSQRLSLPLRRSLRVLGIVVSLGVSAIGGAVMMADWPTFALFWKAPRGAGAGPDPVFGKPLSFYLFTLPAWQLIAGWLMVLAIIACIGAVGFLLISTWDSEEADALWTTACGKKRWLGDDIQPDDIRRLSDEQLWQLRFIERKKLIDRVRRRYASQSASGDDGSQNFAKVLDEHMFTVGFARRFATYKRPNFLLRDPERLIRLLCNPDHPMQLILAGKAHPRDQAGQALIKEWNDFIKRPEVRQHVVFLSDYDMLMAQELVQGADLWINAPRRPWEACGTSGMKVLVNGGLNFSELDGWWAEAYSPQVGWAIGDGKEHGDDPGLDAAEAEAMYTLLEQEVIPEFYERSENGMPSRWLERIRESMARLTPEFSASRTIQEYTENHYLPAATAYSQRAANNSALGAELLQWRYKIAREWHTVRLGTTHIETRDDRHFFQVQVFPGNLPSSDLKVELYASPLPEGGAVIETMTACDQGEDASASVTYSVEVAATRAASDYTPRIVPHHPGVSVPLEVGKIVWQR